jgi:hypothetical protein
MLLIDSPHSGNRFGSLTEENESTNDLCSAISIEDLASKQLWKTGTRRFYRAFRFLGIDLHAIAPLESNCLLMMSSFHLYVNEPAACSNDICIGSILRLQKQFSQ